MNILNIISSYQENNIVNAKIFPNKNRAGG